MKILEIEEEVLSERGMDTKAIYVLKTFRSAN